MKLIKADTLTMLISGALLTLAFAPFHLAILAFICPAILLGCILPKTVKRATWLGALFGIGFFSTSISWVYVSIHQFGNANVFIACLLTALLIIVMALYPALACGFSRYLLNRLTPADTSPIFLKILIIFPLCWLFFEILRGWIGSGFPWVLLGYSQLDTPLRGFAPIIGVYGLSYLTIVMAVLIYGICREVPNHLPAWRFRICMLLTAGILLGLGHLLSRHQWTSPIDKELTISLIQGNIAPSMKWDAEYFDDVLQTYAHLTQSELGQDLIIWPEGAIPAPSYYVADYLAQLEKTLAPSPSTLVLGTFIADHNNQLYNGILVLGATQGQYVKRHLVPFGEYLPLRRWLNPLLKSLEIPMSDLLPGPLNQFPITVHGIKLAFNICYEIAFPSLMWHDAQQANMLVNLSDDSWFGESIAAQQQLQISQMRALETGRPILLANNDGITGLINNQGQVVSALPRDKQMVLKVQAQGYKGETPLVRLWALGNDISL